MATAQAVIAAGVEEATVEVNILEYRLDRTWAGTRVTCETDAQRISVRICESRGIAQCLAATF